VVYFSRKQSRRIKAMKHEDIWLIVVVGFSILWVILMGAGMLG
jgi:hypothetical protein